MKRIERGISELTTGRIAVRWMCGGKLQRRTLPRGTSRADAREFLRTQQGDVDRGLVLPGKVTFDDLAAMLVADYSASENRSTPPLKHLRAAFTGWQAAAITTTAVRQYAADRLAAGAARGTIDRTLAMLTRMFNLGIEAGRIAVKPVIKKYNPRNARKGFFEPEQIARVIAALPVECAAVFEFLSLTGWRVNEALSRRWQHVNWRAGTIRLEPNETKSGEGREFPFAVMPRLKALLERQLADGEPVSSDWVFFHGAGRRIRYERYNKARRAAVRAARCEGRITHDLRRTVIRNLERAGVSRSVAMKLTGHETEAVYGHYAIADSASLREGVAKLATALATG